MKLPSPDRHYVGGIIYSFEYKLTALREVPTVTFSTNYTFPILCQVAARSISKAVFIDIKKGADLF